MKFKIYYVKTKRHKLISKYLEEVSIRLCRYKKIPQPNFKWTTGKYKCGNSIACYNKKENCILIHSDCDTWTTGALFQTICHEIGHYYRLSHDENCSVMRSSIDTSRSFSKRKSLITLINKLKSKYQ